MRMRLRPALTALAACATVAALAAPALAAQASAAPAVAVTPGTREPTLQVTVKGSHFKPAAAVAVSLSGTKLATATPGPGGSFSTAVTIPRGTVSGTHVLTARQAASGDTATAKLVVRVNWPDEHFNPRNTGYNNLETVLSRHNAATLQQTQSASTRPAGGLVLDNGLLLTAGDITLTAMNATTLATEWTATDDEQYAGIAASDGVVYAAAEDGTLIAYNEATGAFEWEYSSGTGRAGTPPVVADGVAYVEFGFDVFAVDLATHQALWTDDLASNGINLALDGSTLYAVDGSLTALDAATGATIWSTALTPSGTDGGIPVIDAAGNIYLATESGAMDAYSPSGTLLWSDALSEQGTFDPAVDGSTLYTLVNQASNDATGASNDLIALNTSDGSTLWETPLSAEPGSDPAIANGVIYATTIHSNPDGNGSLNTYNAATGSALASYPLNDNGNSQPLIANGTIYIGDNGVTAFTPS
jgi:outer membrane protein assembly factor BamB